MLQVVPNCNIQIIAFLKNIELAEIKAYILSLTIFQEFNRSLVQPDSRIVLWGILQKWEEIPQDILFP